MYMSSIVFGNKARKQGFTLIETMVALAVFTIIVGAALSLLVSAIITQRGSLGRQSLVDETSFVAEYMSRALRQAQKDISGTCIPAGRNYLRGAEQHIRFLDRDNKCTKFFLNTLSEEITEQKSTDATSANLFAAPIIPLTSSRLELTYGRFELFGDIPTGNFEQPRVVFGMEVRSRDSGSSIRIQTTVSQRQYDTP
jgi:prepilin-type N-terminal cleavage/methylation domain-containing protein